MENEYTEDKKVIVERHNDSAQEDTHTTQAPEDLKDSENTPEVAQKEHTVESEKKSEKPPTSSQLSVDKEGKFKVGEYGVETRFSSPVDGKKGETAKEGYIFKFDSITHVNNTLWVKYTHNGKIKFGKIGVTDGKEKVKYFGEFIK